MHGQQVEPVTPELALVDPELAARARRRLPDRYTADSFAPAATLREAPLVEPGRRVVGPFPSSRSAAAGRSSREARPSTARYVAAAAVLVLLLAALGGETYLWTVSVRAGGSPPSPKLAQAPPPAAPARAARTFTWPRAPGAAAYRFDLYRGSTRVLAARTPAPRFELGERWRFRGRWYVLVRGLYSWIVTPLHPSPSGLRPGRPIVQATYDFTG